ncbi:MAG: hypothetical protein H6937_08240 [Burkholderiales bacterium]|nr:hypothetical protein [Burkholderiales bacterium]MCP5252644.1 hypothetical protein [Burkholderiales bacterium]
MNKVSPTLPKNPLLKPAEDYYRLRREGIGFIEQMGSRSWTDYNTHDPGVTILEVLCYAITDLAYRTGWDIKDILTPAQPSDDPHQPFPNQPFFTAREILTVNPWTPDDFRRLLIDLDWVRNAWIICKKCACDVPYYAWCEQGQLQLSYQKPVNQTLQPKKVEPLGLYEILLELENDPELGNLNDRKIEHTYHKFDNDGIPHPVTLELRFPEWKLGNWDEWQWFLESADAFAGRNGASFKLELLKLNRDKTVNTFIDDVELRRYWRNVFYVSFEITLSVPSLDDDEEATTRIITIENAALRIFGDNFARSKTAVEDDLRSILEDATSAGFIQRCRNKLLKIKQAVADAKDSLHSHRNLDEDYCRVQIVKVEDIAVCADVEVAPDADIERIQAHIWFEIEQYFNPPVPFYTLQELMDAGIPVEEIFNGPALSNGFIKTEDLQSAELKTALRVSDILNRLMDIEGVVAVNNLLLSKYDADGQPIDGAEAWQLFVSPLHQPRLYHNLSRFLFYKNGLPFLPRMDEAYDTLTQLRGVAERPKIKNAQMDLPIPAGTFRNLEEYFPLQHSFPLTYGIGMEGLPSHATPLRRAQAKQLKAYLMVFEQLLGNAFAQVAHSAELFSLDPAVRRTYFVREFTHEIIQGYDEIMDGLSQAELEALAETQPEFLERRNRFLDHIMARFGEQFSEYSLLLTNLQGKQVALGRLIEDKIAFLNAYPRISHDRGKALNYRKNPCSSDNIAGLKKRISLLLGYPDLTFSWEVSESESETETETKLYIIKYRLADRNETNWLEGSLVVSSDSAQTATHKAYREITVQMTQMDAYEIVDKTETFHLKLKDNHGDPLGQHPVLFQTRTAAQVVRGELLSWSSNERAIVVEHLLLRPKFPGDALYPVCKEGACNTCGDEDPYSFRLTFVMPGWTAPYNLNMEMRNFADRTIGRETPSHLLAKICWVGNDGFIENPCEPVISELADLLMAEGRTIDGGSFSESEACDCAYAIYTFFSNAFNEWYEGKVLDYIHPDALQAALENEFRPKESAEITCTRDLISDLWDEIQTIMVEYFHHVARYGWQFERFAQAWCKWLEANAAFDWTEERLQERIEAILRDNLETVPVAGVSSQVALCQCATYILTQYGMAFYQWMEANFKAGNAFDEGFTSFVPSPIELCDNFIFKENTATKIEALLNERYEAYKEVSYRLWVVVHLLADLRNTYPGATLHDCDDGSDLNPVRLGRTALGNYTLRKTLPP